MSGVGSTVGVEEEYHLVDAVTGRLADRPGVVGSAERMLGDDARDSDQHQPARGGVAGVRLAGAGAVQLRTAAALLVADLLSRLREDLENLGDRDEVAALTGSLLARGTSSARQRAVLARTGRLADVVRAVVSEAAME